MQHNHVNVIGSGGHAKVVLSLLRDLGYEIAGVYDDNPMVMNGSWLGISVCGSLDRLAESPRLPTIIAVPDNEARQAIAARFDCEWLTAVHPAAHIDRSVQFGLGTVVMAGAAIQAGAVLGCHVIINTGATIDHDCVVDDFVHVGPGATLANGVHVEPGVLIEAAAVAAPGIRIGAGSTVRAGASVSADVPSESDVQREIQH